MEIKAWLFFSFWAIISLTFLKLGFDAFDRTNLSASVSPVVLFVFKHLLAISICHASDHTFVHCNPVKIDYERYYAFTGFALVSLVIYVAVGWPITLCFPFHGFICLFWFFVHPAFRGMSRQGTGLVVDFILKLTMISFGDKMKFIPILVVIISCYTSTVQAAVKGNITYEMLPVTAQEVSANTSLSRKKRTKLVQFGVYIVVGIFAVRRRNEESTLWRRMVSERRRLIEFGVGMLGTILFQNFFPVRSFDHVVAFLYLATAWLGNLALLRPAHDLGVFSFLLDNVIVGCTVSHFGLRGTTWIAYGTSLPLRFATEAGDCVLGTNTRRSKSNCLVKVKSSKSDN